MIKHTARLPLGYSAEFTWNEGRMGVAWSPDTPDIRSPRHWRKFFAAYVESRREFLELIATAMNGNVGVVDLPGDPTAIDVVRPATRH